MEDCNIYLTSAYRQTGKDTLYRMLIGQSSIKFNWLIYAKLPDAPSLTFSSNLQRIAFADKLKEEVMDNLNTPIVTYNQEWLESHKDEPIGHGKPSFRQLLKEHALVRRAEKANYWSEIALQDSKGDILVTDFRFYDELDEAKKHGKVTTLRLFRSIVEIPLADEASEHDLDSLATDYLLVQSDDEFKLAVKLWPQYKDYVKMS